MLFERTLDGPAGLSSGDVRAPLPAESRRRDAACMRPGGAR